MSMNAEAPKDYQNSQWDRYVIDFGGSSNNSWENSSDTNTTWDDIASLGNGEFKTKGGIVLVGEAAREAKGVDIKSDDATKTEKEPEKCYRGYLSSGRQRRIACY